jgi:hypothetical protein
LLAKTKECTELSRLKKTAQAKTCTEQFKALKKTETAKQKELTTAIDNLRKVAGDAVQAPVAAPSVPETPKAAPIAAQNAPIPVATPVSTPKPVPAQ